MSPWFGVVGCVVFALALHRWNEWRQRQPLHPPWRKLTENERVYWLGQFQGPGGAGFPSPRAMYGYFYRGIEDPRV